MDVSEALTKSPLLFGLSCSLNDKFVSVLPTFFNFGQSGLHDAQLTVENYNREDTNKHEEPGQNDYPPVRVGDPLTGMLFIIAAAVCDILAMFCIGVCARNNGQNGNYGGIFTGLLAGFGLIAVSVFFASHGLTLINGF